MTKRYEALWILALGSSGWAAVLLGAHCDGPSDCLGITEAGPVDVTLIEPYDSESQFTSAEAFTPSIAQDVPSCQGIDGLDVEAPLTLEAEDPVYGDPPGGCHAFGARVLQGPAVTGEAMLPVDDDEFVNDTALFQTMLVEEGRLEVMGCSGRWLLLVQPNKELFSEPVPGDLPPHVVVRVITFETPCSAGSLPADTERCADVWAAALDPA